MDKQQWSMPKKRFDLRERLFLFACLIVRVVQFLHTRGPIARELSAQILKSGTSAGANYEEADDGSSDRDTLAKRKIVLRELKETWFRLRVLRETDLLLPDQDPVIQEALELKRIVASLVRKVRNAPKSPTERLAERDRGELPTNHPQVSTRFVWELGVGVVELGIDKRPASGDAARAARETSADRLHQLVG